MKTLIIISLALLNIFFVRSYAQSKINKEQLNKVLEVYSRSVSPYLKEIVKTENQGKNDPEMEISRYNYLNVQTRLIDKNVIEKWEKGDLKEKEVIVKYIDFQYKSTYTGLAPNYFEEAHKEVKKLAF